MNKNIEIINENLWAVNQWYINQGYIKELSALRGEIPVSHGVGVTDTGIFILNKCYPSYESIKNMILKIMSFTDEHLNEQYEELKAETVLNGVEVAYKRLLRLERKRRSVKAEYLANLPKPSFKDRTKQFLRKVGESSGIHSDRY